MFEGERLFSGIKRTMEAYFVQGQVRVSRFTNTRMRVTEIDLGGAKISVVRFPIPQIIPGGYGEILVEKGIDFKRFPIRRISYEKPDYVIEEPAGETGVLGRATGYHLDLALAYKLGVSDENLSAIAEGTIIQEEIPTRIADLVLN